MVFLLKKGEWSFLLVCIYIQTTVTMHGGCLQQKKKLANPSTVSVINHLLVFRKEYAVIKLILFLNVFTSHIFFTMLFKHVSQFMWIIFFFYMEYLLGSRYIWSQILILIIRLKKKYTLHHCVFTWPLFL